MFFEHIQVFVFVVQICTGKTKLTVCCFQDSMHPLLTKLLARVRSECASTCMFFEHQRTDTKHVFIMVLVLYMYNVGLPYHMKTIFIMEVS